MEDWEKEDFEPQVFNKPLVNLDRWEGEDEDEDVKDNWDDEEEEKKEEEQPVTIAVQPKKKKTIAQIAAEKEEKKRLEIEAKQQKQMEKEIILTPEEAMADKLRQQKLQEESDLELAKETFGVSETFDKIDDMNPTTKDGFDEFRKALISKISKHEGSPYYLVFVEELCRDLALAMQPDDIKKITVSLNAIATEKIKAQKAAKGKKKSSKKATLNLGKDDLTIVNTYEDEFDDYI